jgi:hypothetical protein
LSLEPLRQTEVSNVVGLDAMRSGVDPILLAHLSMLKGMPGKIDEVSVQVEEVRRPGAQT